MPEPEHVLAVDLGTGGPKVALVSLDGEVVASEKEPVGLRVLPGGGVEQSPAEWWRAVVAAARRVGERAPAARDSVAAVALTGQWAGTVAVDEAGEPLMDAVIWLDSRGAPHVRRVAGGRLRVAGYGPAKLRRWLRLSGGAPSLSGRDPLGHILFLKRERPEVYREAATFLEPVDWLGLRLSGRRATSAVTATLHWLTDTRDLGRVAYDRRLLSLAGVDAAKLPELLPTGSVLGPVLPAAAKELGIAADAPVVAGVPDTMSAAVGSGAVAEHAAHLYLGTSSWLSCHVPYKRTDALHSVASLPSALPDRYLVSCEQETAGACVDRLRDLLLPGTGDDGLVELNRLAGRAPPGSGGVIFAPWLNGERTPVDDHLVRGGFYNLSLDTTREQLARATLEGVALNTRWMQHYVERFTRRELDPLAFIGGGARSPLWCQVMADVLGRTVRQVAQPVEAGVRGAAFLAGIALGRLSADELPERVRIAASYGPDPARRRVYDELYAAFRGIYKSNRRLYARLNANTEET